MADRHQTTRVRLTRNSRGHYAFEHEQRDGLGRSWRLVNSRGHGQRWDYAEALHRAETYASLIGARVFIPISIRRDREQVAS